MDTKNEPDAVAVARGEPQFNSLDRYASYEEGDSVVICDRKNAKAWIKSDVLVCVER